MKTRREWAIALVAVAGATVFLHAPIFIGALTGEPRFFEWDVPEEYWPDLVYLCDALHDGELPYWNPYDRGGYPYYADPQASIYHPLNWMICGVAGRAPSLGWATARTVSAFFLCGVFALLWLRRLDVTTGGAIVGAVSMQTAPFMRHNWELNLTTAFAYLPLMLWAADRAVVERRPRDGALLALSTALCAWVGSPPALYFASSFTGLYVVARLFGEWRRRGGRVLRPAFFALGIAALLGAGLVGAVVVPGLELAEHSVQHGRSFASIAADALAPADLIALVWPQPGNHLYVGVPAVALAAFALAKRRSLAFFFAAVAAVAVLLSLGDSTPAFRAAFDYLPGARLFRLPYRYESWLSPTTAALAAMGASELARRFPNRRWAQGIAGATGGALLALVLLVDVTRALPPERHTRAGTPPGSASAAEHVLPRAPHTRERFRYFDEFGISCRSGTRLRRRDFRGYQDPLLLASYERVVGSLRDAPGLAEQYGVRYALTGPHFIHGWNRHYLPPPDELLTREGAVDRGEGVIELSRALPFAYWTSRVERVTDRTEALARLRAEAPAPVALVEGDLDSQRAGPRASIPADDVVLERDRLSFTVDAPDAGVVVVNEAFYPGWEARVSGSPVAIVRANALVRAIEVPAGRHTVTMEFRPKDGEPLRWLLLLSLLVTGALLSAPLWSRYKAAPWRHRTAHPPRA
jgi:hypothetical protein